MRPPPVLRLALRRTEAHSRGMSAIAVACLIAAQPAGIAITHVTVVDVHQGRLLGDQSVVIAGNKITASGPSRLPATRTGARGPCRGRPSRCVEDWPTAPRRRP